MAKVETTYNELESANVIDIYITRAATNDYFHCWFVLRCFSCLID